MSYRKDFSGQLYLWKIPADNSILVISISRSFAKPCNKQNPLTLLIDEFPKAAVTDQDIFISLKITLRNAHLDHG